MSRFDHKPYRVTLHPGQNVDVACVRLAKYVIDRWMPNHAGGAPVLLGPKLARSLRGFFDKANTSQKDVVISIHFEGHIPVISET